MSGLLSKGVVLMALFALPLFSGTWTLTTGGMWNTGANWSDTTVPNNAGAQAIFDDTITSTAMIDLTGGPFTVGTLQITTNNHPVTIGMMNTPQLQIDGGSAAAQLGFSGAVEHVVVSNLVFNSAVSVNQTATLGTISGNITGTGAITNVGGQTLVLSGANSFSGALAINAGTVQFTGLNTITGMTTVNAGGMLETTGSGSLGTQAPVTLAGGSFTVNSAGQIGTLSGTTGSLILAQALDVTQAGDATLSTPITGMGDLTKQGSSLLTLAGDNSGWMGNLILSEGTLALSDNNSIGQTASLTLDGGVTLQLAPNASSVVYSQGVTINGAATLDTNGSALVLSGALTGMDAITKIGTGGLSLFGNNNGYSGNFILSDGQLSVNNNNSAGTGTLTLEQGSLIATATIGGFAAGIDATGPAAINVGGGLSLTLLGMIQGGGVLTKTGSGTVVFGSGVANMNTGGWIVNAGTVVVNNNGSLGTGDVTLQGVTLQTGTGGLMVNNSLVLVTNSNLIDTAGGSLNLSGSISGPGGWTKTGANTLTLSGANSYFGLTQLAGGTLALGHVNSLGNSPQLALAGGTLTTNVQITFGGLVTLSGPNTINTAANDLVLTSLVTSSGSVLTKTGGQRLAFSGRASLGDLVINAGTVEFLANSGAHSIGNLSGAGGDLAFNNTALTINQSAGGSYGGNVMGSGTLIKNGGGTLNLTGTGSTLTSSFLIINGGELSIATQAVFPFTLSGLSGSGGTIQLNGNEVVIDQSVNTIFAGNIEGTTTLTKAGAGTLTLTGVSGLVGDFDVNGGTLEVNGSLNNSDMTVNTGATLTGTGSVRMLTLASGATFSPGDPTGTFTVTNDYSQMAGSRLDIGIETLSSDQVRVGGEATLAGTLDVTVTGSCFLGQMADVLVADGGVVADALWDTINVPPACGFIVNLIDGTTPDAQIVRLMATQTALFIGQTIDPGNPTAVKEYLDCLNVTIASDLVPALAAASALNDRELNEALNQYHPGLFGAFELASLDSHVLITTMLAHQMEMRPACRRRRKGPNEGEQRGWIAPFGDFTFIEEYEQLRGYETASSGVLLGYDVALPLCAVLGWSVGYHYTDLKWDQSLGEASANTFLGGFYLGYSGQHLSLDVEAIGGENFYDVNRRISYTGFQAEAHNNHRGYFFTPRAGAALTVYPGKERVLRLFAAGYYDYLYQEDYSEGGAGGLNLAVKKRVSRFVETVIGLCFAADMQLERGTLYLFGSPTWVHKRRLDNGQYRSKFRESRTSPCLLVVDTLTKSKDFVGVDLGFFHTLGVMTTSLVYHGQFSHNYRVNQIEGKWQWSF